MAAFNNERPCMRRGISAPAASSTVGAMSTDNANVSAVRPPRISRRMSNDQRALYRFFVGEPAFDAQAVLAEERAVVAHEHEQRIFELRYPERAHEPADSLVNGEHHLGTRLDRAVGNLLIEHFRPKRFLDLRGMFGIQRRRKHGFTGTIGRGQSVVRPPFEDLAGVAAAVTLARARIRRSRRHRSCHRRAARSAGEWPCARCTA